ncbi:hypothetical protein DMA12_15385 [Amycolatopsis balhimycina DSM 5908]|uniref:FAD-binding domain-containing protein n=1 Tax=Amycolatopsis balhimycina DSM 5908 TaxID=1081091 RepID=A0A428WP88_AMYBA|nr:hypothetical protein DMA12_15385 [Amycolatopsis balhimycina DSM 5908]
MGRPGAWSSSASGVGTQVEVEVRADLTVACDGRRSVLRAASGLPVREFEVPFDLTRAQSARRQPRAGNDRLLLTGPTSRGTNIRSSRARPAATLRGKHRQRRAASGSAA